MIHSMEQRNFLLLTMMVVVTQRKKYRSVHIEDTVFQLMKGKIYFYRNIK